MIKFRMYSSAKSGVIRSASLGAAIGAGLNKAYNIASKGDVTSAVNAIDGAAASAYGKVADIIGYGTGRIGDIQKSLRGASNKFFQTLSTLGSWIIKNPKTAMLSGAIIGASLAIGYYLIKAAYSRGSSAKARFDSNSKLNSLTSKIDKALSSSGYVNGKHYCMDPATADRLKTRVCIVIDSGSEEASLTINSVNEPKLEPVSRYIIKNLPSGYTFYRRDSDKSNELTLASIPTSNLDPVYIASIAERFIKKGYPVFILQLS